MPHELVFSVFPNLPGHCRSLGDGRQCREPLDATFSLTSWPKNTICVAQGRRLGGFLIFWPRPESAPAPSGPHSVPESYIMSGSALYETFARAPLSFDRGEGRWLFAEDGERYLDFGGGIAVNSLGHAHPHAGRGADRAGRQALAHLQPLRVPGQERLAERLVEAPSPTRCSSPIPAPRRSNARSRWRAATSSSNGHPERFRIITFEGAFHGRTLATIAAGGQAEISRRLRPQGRRLRPGRLRRPRRAPRRRSRRRPPPS